MTGTELLEVAKPILFNTEMVRAILDGRKTVTRRAVPERLLDKYYDYDDWCNAVMPRDIPCTRAYERDFFMARAPYQPGDILYVRETWQEKKMLSSAYFYKANDNLLFGKVLGKWRPSIHMPKEAARIFLRVTNVRVESLQDITRTEAKAEGAYEGPLLEGNDYIIGARESFIDIWNSTVKKQDIDCYGWDANTWVWVYEFERLEVE